MAKILLVNGSINKDSLHQKYLNYIQASAPAGFEFSQFSLRDLPIFDPNDENKAEFQAAREAVKNADAVLIASPEYNRSLSGALKNFIDVCSRPYGNHAWLNRKVAIISASPSLFAGLTANLQTRNILQFLNANVLVQPEVSISQAHNAIDASGNITNENVEKLLKQFSEKFFNFAKN